MSGREDNNGIVTLMHVYPDLFCADIYKLYIKDMGRLLA